MELRESNRVECKAVLNDKLEKEIVAFLNNREGGVLYIGVDDDGTPIGVRDMDDVQLKIADRIKTNILPGTLGLYDIVSETIDGITVIKILIAGGPEKPYYIRSQGMSPSGCFMRIGTSTQPMTTAVIEELFSRRVHTTLRNMVSPRQDLTFAQLKIYYEERGLSLNEKFASTLELLTPDGKYNYIAYLLADENGVSVKVAKYAGKDKVDLIENEEYGYCSLIKATNRVLEKMQIENKTFARVTSTKRMEKNLVDAVAMREAIVNAIVHNDYTREIPPVFELYSDRIVMSSYGGLMMGQSEDDFFSCASMPRNRELMRVFKDVGLVEQLGSGMSRILRAYDREVFQISDHFIKVVFPFEEEIAYSSPDPNADPILDPNLDPKDQQNSEEFFDSILLLLKENPNLTRKDLSMKLSCSDSSIKRAIAVLKERGVLVHIGSTRTGYWQVQDKTE